MLPSDEMMKLEFMTGDSVAAAEAAGGAGPGTGADVVEVAFSGGAAPAGRYRIDPAKSFLHPLRTASGHVLSLASPHDHLHHRGLMFALQTPEVSWWDEVPHPDSRHVGRQRQLGLLPGNGDDSERSGLVQELSWEAADGSLPTFAETRTVECREVPGGFEWRWHTSLRALRACTLSQARHGLQLADGRRINYQGLSLRLARDLAQGSRLYLDGERVPFGEATGSSPNNVRLEGRLDPEYPEWPGPPVAVSIETKQPQGLFALQQPFPYLAVGPSNLEPLQLEAEQLLEAEYLITVADLNES